MRYRVFSVWLGSGRPGFFLGTTLLVALIFMVYAAGPQTSLSLGPGGDFPRFRGINSQTEYGFPVIIRSKK